VQPFFVSSIAVLLGVGALAGAVTLGIIPLVTQVARRYGLLDHPDGDRRIHTRPVPRLGGVGILAGVVVAIATLSLLPGPAADVVRNAPLLPGMLWGAAIIFTVGLLDDLGGVKPLHKLLAQTAAALVAVSYGFDIQAIGLSGVGTITLGPVGTALAVLWIVGISNAFNLIDGLDGLAGGVAFVGLFSVVTASALLHNSFPMIIAFAVIGSTFAFLRYNRTPATIFLGDSGSLVMGFLLAILSVSGATGADHVTQAAVPLAGLAFPIADTAIAMARRWLRSEPLSRADGRHVHHQLLALGLTPARTVSALVIFFAFVAAGGLALAFASPRLTLALIGATSVSAVIGIVYAIRWLKYDEFIEASASLASAMRKARDVIRFRILARELGRAVGTADSLESLVAILNECAPDLRLQHIEIVRETPLDPVGDGVIPARVAQRPWKLDCPINIEDPSNRHAVTMLRIWSDRSMGGTSVSAERVAARLIPEIEAWMRRQPGAAETKMTKQERRRRDRRG
jgi:UDP-GlcNAc:undecaprenyl-phosphate GlcNAc-1-phosphate transferase